MIQKWFGEQVSNIIQCLGNGTQTWITSRLIIYQYFLTINLTCIWMDMSTILNMQTIHIIKFLKYSISKILIKETVNHNNFWNTNLIIKSVLKMLKVSLMVRMRILLQTLHWEFQYINKVKLYIRLQPELLDMIYTQFA
jgi:hypothetical protein